jgi:import receptor subunit TOM70
VVEETPLERTQKLRGAGNDLFKLKKHEDAIKCYTEAISICPLSEVDQLAMLYQNRAAAYDVLVCIFS